MSVVVACAWVGLWIGMAELADCWCGHRLTGLFRTLGRLLSRDCESWVERGDRMLTRVRITDG